MHLIISVSARSVCLNWMENEKKETEKDWRKENKMQTEGAEKKPGWNWNVPQMDYLYKFISFLQQSIEPPQRTWLHLLLSSLFLLFFIFPSLCGSLNVLIIYDLITGSANRHRGCRLLHTHTHQYTSENMTNDTMSFCFKLSRFSSGDRFMATV